MSTVALPGTTAYRPNAAIAARLARDLRAACIGMRSFDWTLLVARSLADAGKTTAQVRWRSARSVLSRVADTVRHTATVGPLQAAQDAFETARAAIEGLPARTRSAWDRFRAMTRGRQADEIAQMLLTWMVFYGASGGSDLEGGLPDLDLALDVGSHRSVFTHSVLLGLEIEVGLRFGLYMLDGLIDRMPDDRHPVWGRISDALSRYGERTLTGVWLGIGAHLVKDAGLLHLGATKPVVHLPVSMPMEAHQAFLAANGIACAAVAASKPDGAPARQRRAGQG